MKTCSLCDTDLISRYYHFTIYPENEHDIACIDCFETLIHVCDMCHEYFNGDGSICPSCELYEGE